MEPINICTICLRTDRTLKNIDTILSVYHNKITNYSLQLINSLYCSDCEYLLRKTYNFHQKCLNAAEILKTWLATAVTKETNITPASMLHTKLPQTNLAIRTAQNSVFSFVCTENDTPVLTIETNQVDGASNEFSEISITQPQNFNRESEDTKNIFQYDNCLPVAGFSGTTNFVKKENNTKSKSHEAEQGNELSYIEIVPDINDILKKKENENRIPIQTDIHKLSEVKSLNGVSVNTSNDDDEVIYLNNGNNDIKTDIIQIDEENKYPDDASLNSNDDCDEYLDIVARKIHKNKTLVKLGDIEIHEEDLAEDYVYGKETIGSVSFTNSIEKFIAVQIDIDSKLESMNKNLDSICKDWEVTTLSDIEFSNVPKNEILTFIRKFLTDKKVASKIRPGRSNQLKKMPLKNKLANMKSDLDLINEACANIVEDHKEGLIAPKERVKAELTQRLEKWGEIKSDNGYVFDIDVIVNCLDMAPTGVVSRLLKYLRDTRDSKRLIPGITRYLNMIQSKQQLEKYKSVFDIEHMKTEKEAMEEFEKRKTYECYLNAKHKCDVCYQVFKYEGMLEYHKKYHDESSGPIRCNICKINFNTQRRHQTHKLSHEVVYKCKLCPLVTYYVSSMQNHYEQHKGTVYKCDKCDMTYKSKSVFLTHQTRAHLSDGHVCTVCGGVFISATGLRIHKYRKHSDEPPPAPSGDEVKCESCNLTFASPQAYHKHQLKLHRANVVRPTYVRHQSNRLIPRKKPIMTCKVCNKVGHSYGWMVLHFKSEHPTMDMTTAAYADKRTNLCDVCGKGFTTIHTLRKHIRIHHTGVTFPCPKCGKRFPSTDSLRNHRYMHGPRKFCCDQCGKKFRSPSNLYSHMRSHTRDRRYKCNICGKGFLFRNSIKEHIRGVHNHERRVRKRATKRSRSIEDAPDYSETGEMGLGVGDIGEEMMGMDVGGKQFTELN